MSTEDEYYGTKLGTDNRMGLAVIRNSIVYIKSQFHSVINSTIVKFPID